MNLGRRCQRFYILFLICMVWLTVWSNSDQVMAAKPEKIKVGVFELNAFFEKNDQGVPEGYGVDYLNKIAEYTGWTYEYIWAENWDECVELLKEKKVDLIAPAQKTQERMKSFDFSSFNIGMECGTLLALSTNEKLIYEDFQSFQNIQIGYVDTLIFKDSFLNYAKENEFQPNLVSYRDTKALMAALNAGEVDAALVNLFVETDTTKVLGKFGAAPFYFMLQKGNLSFREKLDNALQQIKIEFSDFETDLMQKYYPTFNNTPFTKSELEYIKAAPVLTIGCRLNIPPISYMDEETGEMKGITTDIMKEISEISGLKFEYVALPEGAISYDYLREQKISLIASVEYNKENVLAKGIKLTIPYMDSKKVFVSRPELKFDTDKALRIAIATGSYTLEKVIKEEFPNFTVERYNSVEECFEAVRNKKADMLLQNQYAVEPWLVKPLYTNFITVPVESLEDKMCLSPVIYQQKDVEDKILGDERLIKILNKSIRQISSSDIAKIIIRQSSENHYRYTIMDFLYQYRYALIIICIISIILLIICIYTIRMKRKSMKIIAKNEEKLRNIANNINGGVVVLTVYDELRITYANDGFLELLQCSTEEYKEIKNQKYVTYIHPEDAIELKQILEKKNLKNNRISTKLRIMRKDGEYIPTLFNGTVTENEQGEQEIYCVIMDNSIQEELMAKISLEQEKYYTLIENSGDIIFEVDCKAKKGTVSPLYEKKFGWKIHHMDFSGKKLSILHTLNIHEEDCNKLELVIRKAFEEKKRVETVARVMKTDGTYLWCRIAQYPMVNSEDKLVYVIGKILDIDDEIREKEELEQKSRTDALTGLLNKEAFYLEAKEYLGSQSDNQNTAIIFIDIDNFKQVNDRLGHMVGDQAIKETAKKLQVIFSNYDILSRFGGDEFCLLLKEIPEETLRNKLEWTVEKLQTSYSNKEESVECSASIGAVCTKGRKRDLKQLMEYADQALYKAKENGKNQYIIYYDGME